MVWPPSLPALPALESPGFPFMRPHHRSRLISDPNTVLSDSSEQGTDNTAIRRRTRGPSLRPPHPGRRLCVNLNLPF